MCGITGIFALNKAPREGLIHEMTSCLAHRGPDAQGIYTSPNKFCSLGHRRLSIIDLSEGANQPMESDDENCIIVYNGEVYNFEEIRVDLMQEGISFKTNSDTEVILKSFLHWGDDFIDRLNGMFAIAIYHITSHQLVLYRDRLGIKPLYYYYRDGIFAFASELKSLTKLVQDYGRFQLNIQAVNSYLRTGFIAEPHTIYEEVNKFPAGQKAIVNEAGLEFSQFWSLDQLLKPTIYSDEIEAKKELKRLIESSVKYRLKSDVPFGVFLSGGIDSSTVAAVAQSINDAPIKTFSIAFKEQGFNEAEYALKVAQYIGSDHHEYEVSYKDALDIVPQLHSFFDEPFADSSAIPTFLVSKLAKNQVSMVLTGDGGDEQFLGYGMYTWAKRLHDPLISFLKYPIHILLKGSASNRAKRASELFDFGHHTNLEQHIFSVEQYLFSHKELKQIIQPKFHRTEPVSVQKQARQLSHQERQAFFDLKKYLKDDLLTKVDRTSMRASLEARVPLLDHRIVAFSLNLDERLKIKRKETKYLLKQVLYDYVPAELFQRPKWGFSLPLKDWLKNELRSMLEEYVSAERLQEIGLFHVDEILKIKSRYLAGADYLYNKLWTIMMFVQWYEHHKQFLVDGKN